MHSTKQGEKGDLKKKEKKKLKQGTKSPEVGKEIDTAPVYRTILYPTQGKEVMPDAVVVRRDKKKLPVLLRAGWVTGENLTRVYVP